MKNNIFLIFLTFLAFGIKAQRPPISVKENGFWYFRDSLKNRILKDSFVMAYDFSEGIAAVRQSGKYGYITRNGTWSIMPKYDFAGKFIDGIASVWTNGKRKLIDKKGVELLSLEDINDDFYDFYDESKQFLVFQKSQNEDYLFGLITKSGVQKIPCHCHKIDLYNNIIRCYNENGIEFYDKEGKLLIKGKHNSEIFLPNPDSIFLCENGECKIINKAGKAVQN
jgi:hypothetical protein